MARQVGGGSADDEPIDQNSLTNVIPLIYLGRLGLKSKERLAEARWLPHPLVDAFARQVVRADRLLPKNTATS